MTLMNAPLKTESVPLKIVVRSATIRDCERIGFMVEHWAKEGENLPRDKENIAETISDFLVTEYQGQVAGCASLYQYGKGLAEIRSLGVDPNFEGVGQGRILVEAMLKKAKNRFIKRVFVLTRKPGFFLKLGFCLTTKSSLPEKVMKDCSLCPRQDNCDEVPLDIGF